jgi:hypothetical protein
MGACRWIWRSLLVTMVFVVVSSALAHSRAPNARTQPAKDGCQRSPYALLAGTTPEWVYVYNTPASRPIPAPRWVSGVVSSHNPRYSAAAPSGSDLPNSHIAHDFNVDIAPDPRYRYLVGGSAANGTGNYAGNDDSTTRLHTEWEDLTLPRFAWPQAGDRVRELGSWVWDCGHWGSSVSVFDPMYESKCGGNKLGSPSCPFTGEGTEFHPYRVLWDLRAGSPRSPYREQQADLFISTDQTPAGTIADCAHKHPPPSGSTQAYGSDYVSCLQSAHAWQNVSGRYSFFIPAPRRPDARARLRYRAINRGTVGAPAPKLIPEARGVRVVLNVRSRRYRHVVVAYTFFVGWTDVAAARLPTHLRVRFVRLVVHRAMDPGCTLGAPFPQCMYESTNTLQMSKPPGEWDLYLDVGGIWRSWAGGSGEFQPVDGQVFPGTQTVDLYVPKGRGWTLYVQGRECDLGGLKPNHPPADCPTDTSEVATGDDVPGQIVNTFASAAASVGMHISNGQTAAKDPTSTCPAINPSGCYTLTYTVTILRDARARARALRKRVPPRAPGAHHSP